MKRIVEFDTALATTNLGDEIILRSLRQELAFLYRDAFIVRYGTHVKNFSASNYYARLQKVAFAERADYKLIMGANLLSGDLKKSRLQWPVCGVNGWLYENVILAGVGTTYGTGKITAYSRKVYNNILRQSFCHSVRDEESKRFLESMGFKAINTGCPTLWSLTPEFCQSIPHGKAGRAIFSLSGYREQRDVPNDRARIEVLKRNYGQLYFWCQTVMDETYLDSFKDLGVADIPRVYSLEEYARLLDEGDIDYVGTRLHGGIMALQHGVRAIVISIDHRAQGFHDSNNLAICDRSRVGEDLEGMINSDFETRIDVDRDAIDAWKAQFSRTDLPKNSNTYNKRPLVRATRWIAKYYKALVRRIEK